MTVAENFPKALNPSEEDVRNLLAAKSHIGTRNCETAMNPYVYARTPEG